MSDDSGFEDVDDEQQPSSKIEIVQHQSSGFEDAPENPPEEHIFDESDLKEENKKRFVRELEFVQALANPQYLNFLATQNYFNDPAFCRFLQYLLYWDTPKYSKYIRYPQCLFYLHQLQDPQFRTFLSNPVNIMNINYHTSQWWKYYMTHRLDLSQIDDEKIDFVSLIPKTEKRKKHKDKKHKSKDKDKDKESAKATPH